MTEFEHIQKSFWLVIFVLIFEIAFALLFISSDLVRVGVRIESKWIEQMYGPVAAEAIKTETKQMYQELVVEPELKKEIYRYFNVDEAYLIPQTGLKKMHRWSFPWLIDRIDTFVMMLWWLFRRYCIFSMWFWLCLPAFVIAIGNGHLERKIAQTNFKFSSPILRLVSWKLTWTMIGCVIASFILPCPLPPFLVPFIIVGVSALLGMSLGNVAKRF